MQPNYVEENGQSRLIRIVEDADYVLSSFDNGATIAMLSAAPHTVSYSGNLPGGFHCRVIQLGAGQVEVIKTATTSVFAWGDPYNIRTRSQYARIEIEAWEPNSAVVSGQIETLEGLTYADFIQQQYDVADLSALADNDPVSPWVDNVGTADAASSGTAQPIYKTNAGNPYIEWDGVNDYLQLTLDAALNDYTICMIVEEVTHTADYCAYLDQGFYEGINIFSQGTGTPITSSDHGTQMQVAKPAVPTGFMGVYLSRRNDTAKLRVNGVESAITSGGSTAATTLTMAIGAGDGGNPVFANIRAKRLIIFRVGLNDTHFGDLAADMLSQYGVTI